MMEKERERHIRGCEQERGRKIMEEKENGTEKERERERERQIKLS
jgi:hypothetical protein